MKRRARAGIAATCIVAALSGCSRGEAPPLGRMSASAIALPPAQFLLSMEDGIAAAPREIAVDTAGRVYLLDVRHRRVVIVAPDGEVLSTVGRPGTGPGGLLQPQFLGVLGERLFVFDARQQRVNVFSTAGDLVEAHALEVGGMATAMSFGPDGQVVYAGTKVPPRGGLFAVADLVRDTTSVYGRVVSRHVELSVDFVRDVRGRTLPPSFRNQSLPMPGVRGSVWLFLQTESVLQLYSPVGTLLWEVLVDVPEREDILEEYFGWYESVGSRGILRFFTFVESGVSVDESLWLLWNTPREDPWRVTIHDNAGDMIQQLVMPERSVTRWQSAVPRRRIAVDCPRRRLYVLDGGAPAVVWFALPEDVGGCRPRP